MEFSSNVVNGLEMVLVPFDALIELFWIETESER